MPTSVHIRPLTTFDISFAVAQIAREGWDADARLFRVLIELAPDGCFVAELAGRPAGLVTTTSYVRTAWVGNLVVEPEFRGRGVGRALMEHALAHLAERGMGTIWLDGDPPGVPLYRRLGFLEACASLRFRRPALGTPPDSVVVPLQTTDLPAIAAFDARCGGDNRARLLRALLAIAVAGWYVPEARGLRGYALALPTRSGVRIGPWVAADDEAAAALLSAMLGLQAGTTLAVGVAATNSRGVALLEAAGFERTPPSLRMRRGPADPVPPTMVYGIANGAVG